MLDNIIVNKTSPEANWNRQANRQADAKDHVLSQADTLTKKLDLGIPQGTSYVG